MDSVCSNKKFSVTCSPQDLREFFQWMQKEGFMNNTVVFLLADHGAWKVCFCLVRVTQPNFRGPTTGFMLVVG